MTKLKFNGKEECAMQQRGSRDKKIRLVPSDQTPTSLSSKTSKGNEDRIITVSPPYAQAPV